MYLIDTSVWIDFLRKKQNPPVQHLNLILEQNLPFGITGVIYQEILQGAASQNDFEQLTTYFSTQHFFHPKDKILSHQSAAELFFNCRKKGITLRSTIDCLIAQIAIEHELVLLHNDKDYVQIKKIASTLKIYQ
jgi:predicted nucleic acid-binding protein